MPEQISRKKVRTRFAMDRKQCVIIPSFAVMNERFYYGYPVIAIAFGWLWFRFKVEFGVKVVKF